MTDLSTRPASTRDWLLSDAPSTRRQARLGALYQGWLTFRANTLAMVGLVAFRLLAWINRLSSLARVGHMIDLVERHALEALEQIARDLPWELTGLQADTIAALRERLGEGEQQ